MYFDSIILHYFTLFCIILQGLIPKYSNIKNIQTYPANLLLFACNISQSASCEQNRRNPRHMARIYADHIIETPSMFPEVSPYSAVSTDEHSFRLPQTVSALLQMRLLSWQRSVWFCCLDVKAF